MPGPCCDKCKEKCAQSGKCCGDACDCGPECACASDKAAAETKPCDCKGSKSCTCPKGKCTCAPA